MAGVCMTERSCVLVKSMLDNSVGHRYVEECHRCGTSWADAQGTVQLAQPRVSSEECNSRLQTDET